MKILVVEDDLDLALIVAKGLRQENYSVDVAHDCAQATELLITCQYDLVCLDLNLPDGDGLSLCQRWRTDQYLLQPHRILMITARDAVTERVNGLDAGADDYLVKPFEFDELTARIRALFRRRDQGGEVITISDLQIDVGKFHVRRGTREVSLSGKEFAVLRYLAFRVSEIVSTEELIEHCWDSTADSRSLSSRVILSRLRRKLGDPPIIKTIKGVGYRLCDQSS